MPYDVQTLKNNPIAQILCAMIADESVAKKQISPTIGKNFKKTMSQFINHDPNDAGMEYEIRKKLKKYLEKLKTPQRVYS